MKQRLKFKRFFASLLLLAVSALSWAYDFKVDGIYYDIKSDGTSVNVSSQYLQSRSYVGAIVIPSTVTYNNITYSVTGIETGAFWYCSGLTSIDLPEGVTSIGVNAFTGCTGLTSISIPNSVTSISYSAFENCSGLTSITLPNSVASIGSSAFSGCSGLTSITIPSNVTSIGSSAFSGCSGLTSITIPSNVTSIGDYVFSGCSGLTSIVIPESVMSIGNNAFFNCSGLTSIDIPNGVTSIGGGAFSGCSGLTSITIPNSVTSIGSNAFSGCSELTSVTLSSNSIVSNNYSVDNNFRSIFGSQVTEYIIGDAVTSIGDYAFYNCSEMTSITIGSGVTSIAGTAFDGCSGLTKAEFASIESLCSIPFAYSNNNPLYYAHHLYINGQEVKDLEIPESITSIGSSAFSGCSGLTSVTIPNSVTSIGGSAFSGCSGLTSVTIPNSVTSIGGSAFSGCSGLTSVTIGSSVTSIGGWSFSGCSGLTSIVIPEGVTSIGEYAFYGCSGLTSVTLNSNSIVSNTYSSNNNFRSIFGSQVTECVIGDAVTSIGGGFFSGCSGLTSVTIGNSVTSIGNYAFEGCSGLTSITIPEGVMSIGQQAFYGCSGLTSITIPEGVMSIGESAFSYCSGLTSVTIGNSVTSIGNYAFSNCSGLTSIVIPESVMSIGNNAFFNCSELTTVTLNSDAVVSSVYTSDYNLNSIFGSQVTEYIVGDDVTSIGANAFYGCSGLTSITIPEGVTSIGEYAFYGCSGLTSVTLNSNSIVSNTYSSNNNFRSIFGSQVTEYIIGDVVTSIGTYAFYNCSGLTSVTIGNNVTSIGNSAFSGCSGLESITLPNNVTNIGYSAFSGCSGLTSVMIGNSVTSIGSYAFQNCSGLTSVTIGNNVTSIGNSAFSGCSGLVSIDIPEGVTSIGNSAFYNCSGLVSIDIPEGVTSIGNSAFNNCSGLTSVTIPESVTSIGDWAFEGCTSLPVIDNIRYADTYLVKAVDKTKSTYNIKDETRFIGSEAFSDCTGLTSVTIPNSVTSIGGWSFSGCSGLTSVVIPNSVTSLGSNALNSANLLDIKFVSDIPAARQSNTFMGNAFLFVPSEALETYKTAWSGVANRIYSDDLSSETTESTAIDGKSALLDAIGGVGMESSIVLLKVRGSLNGYDIMLLRNKMTNLRYLDLSEARIVKEANNYEYYTGCYTEDDVLGANSFRGLGQLLKVVLPKDITSINENAFYGCSNLVEVTGMPATCLNIGASAFRNCQRMRGVDIGTGVTSIAGNAFYGCSGLTSVTIPNSVTSIGSYAFSNCSALTEIVFSRNLESIAAYAFNNCSSLKELKLPAALKHIEAGAFSGCTSLKEVHIPSMMESIADNVFTVNSITDVYAYSLSPISIGQNTFNYNATLHAPQTPESVFNAYYYNTQWSQFTSVVDFQAEYSSWYAPEDYDIVVESGEEIPSEDKETGANGEMQPGSGLIYEEGASQKLDWLSLIWQDGKNFPSLIYNENVDINNLSITLNVQKNKWYFFCFPFNVNLTNASYPSKHYVWRYYDGDERALHGVGGWKNTVGNTLTAGQGYIFQTNKAGNVVLTIASPTFGNGDTEVALTAHASGELQDANWNFVGNKNLSYYDINALTSEFQSPITVWDAANSTYTAIVPGDDDYSFHPYEAFFVQKPNGKNSISFGSEGRETYCQKQSMAAARAIVRAASAADDSRKIVNLTLSDGNKTDKTRVVFNDERSESYEQECDASKFLSNGVPQIYTVDAKRVKYAINERSKGTGIVNIGYVAAEAGTYVISAPRMDCPMTLKDNVTGAICKLSGSAYEFETEAGTNESRFTLIPDGETSVKDVKSLGGLSLRAVSGGIDVKGLNGKSVAIYSIGGAMITSAASDGMISLPAGVYVVSYDGNNVKMSVR